MAQKKTKSVDDTLELKVKRPLSHKGFYTLLLTALLGMFLFVTYYASQQTQITKSKAATSWCSGATITKCGTNINYVACKWCASKTQCIASSATCPTLPLPKVGPNQTCRDDTGQPTALCANGPCPAGNLAKCPPLPWALSGESCRDETSYLIKNCRDGSSCPAGRLAKCPGTQPPPPTARAKRGEVCRYPDPDFQTRTCEGGLSCTGSPVGFCGGPPPPIPGALCTSDGKCKADCTAPDPDCNPVTKTGTGGDEPCLQLGGSCKQPDSVANCPNGSYTSNLCGGPANRRCCIPNSAVANKKTITVEIRGGRGNVKDLETPPKINCTTRGEGVKHCSKQVNYNGGFELTAIPADGFIFEKWNPVKWCNAINFNGDAENPPRCKGKEVKQNRTVIANFVETGGGGPTNTPTPTPTPEGPTNTPTPTVTPGGPTVTPPVPGCSRQGVVCDSKILPGPWSPCCSGLTCSAVDATTSTCQGGGGGANVTINLKLRFQGIVKKPAGGDLLKVKVTLVGGGAKQQKIGGFTVDNNGIWSGTVGFDNVAPGAGYAVLVKGERHMQKKVCDAVPTETSPGTYRCGDGNIDIADGTSTLDLSGIVLLVGDLPVQDGIVDAYDSSLIRNGFCTTDKPNICKDPKLLSEADLNLDGIIDSQDWSLLIASLSIKYDEN